MNKERPLLIVISSNRNYGWIVPVFLAANSRWADYIIITDQMSTDGSREMYTKYPNVIVVDDKDMASKRIHELAWHLKKVERLQQVEMLFISH